ncbi:hypothetical protein [Pseudonocardia sp. T1-2H]|uniref:hypothetical protein n=1 Tax=Pseudonocardia sp. T1-2H TaxID=3128899 RepID=UPI003100C90C
MTTAHHHRAEDRAGTDRVDAPLSTSGGWVRAAVWLPGLAVAVGAAVATAHGLYEVAAAATVPTLIAWLYPLITDGLALVAYTATARLAGSARRYAWGVVVLAAGLSGLAQASYLASVDTSAAPGADGTAAAFEVSAALRFGIGAWPAIAAAVVAHLLYLLAESARPEHDRPPAAAPSSEEPPVAVAPPRPEITAAAAPVTEPLTVVREQVAVELVGAPVLALSTGHRSGPGVHPALFNTPAVQADALNTTPTEHRPEPGAGVQPGAAPAVPARRVNSTSDRSPSKPLDSPVRDRAEGVARAHLERRGALPTVSELEQAAQVSRGTAAAVLKTLRETPNAVESQNYDRSLSENEHQNS